MLLDDEVIKYTLISYLGDYTNTNKNKDKEEILDKIRDLPKDNFENLLKDIVNEIHRRNGIEYDLSDSRMRKKLRKLKDDKFKNLISDVLILIPEDSSSVHDEISKLSQLVGSLRFEEDLYDNIVNETNTNLKYKLFIEYMQDKYIKENDKIFEHMVKFNEESLSNKFEDSLETCFNYKIFIEKMDNSKYSKLEEYQIYKNNLLKYSQYDLDIKIKKKLIKNEFSNLIKLIIENQYFSEENSFKIQVSKLIQSIENIKGWKNDYIEFIYKNIPLEDCLKIKKILVKLLDCIKSIKYLENINIDKLLNLSKKPNLSYGDIHILILETQKILEKIKSKKWDSLHN